MRWNGLHLAFLGSIALLSIGLALTVRNSTTYVVSEMLRFLPPTTAVSDSYGYHPSSGSWAQLTNTYHGSYGTALDWNHQDDNYDSVSVYFRAWGWSGPWSDVSAWIYTRTPGYGQTPCHEAWAHIYDYPGYWVFVEGMNYVHTISEYPDNTNFALEFSSGGTLNHFYISYMVSDRYTPNCGWTGYHVHEEEYNLNQGAGYFDRNLYWDSARTFKWYDIYAGDGDDNWTRRIFY